MRKRRFNKIRWLSKSAESHFGEDGGFSPRAKAYLLVIMVSVTALYLLLKLYLVHAF